MAITEARKRANDKWRKAHPDYFNNWMKNKYANDPIYRQRCKDTVRRSRELKKEASRIMAIQI